MRELARLPGFLLAELLGRLVANALVALLGWASDQLMHHVRYASPAVDTENLWRGTYGVSTATQRWFVSLTAEMPGSLRMPSTRSGLFPLGWWPGRDVRVWEIRV